MKNENKTKFEKRFKYSPKARHLDIFEKTGQAPDLESRIKTPTGDVLARDLKVGDEVIGYDSGAEVINTVEEIDVFPLVNRYIQVNDSIRFHPHQTVYANGNYVHALQLDTDDILIDANGFELSVVSALKVDGLDSFARLKISGNHTYYSDNILVHNASRYWVGNSGNWSDNTNHWSASSGGAPGASLPTSSDDVFFNASSFSIASQIVAIDTLGSAVCLSMDWTGVTNTPTLAFNGTSTTTHCTLVVAGNLTFVSGMIVTSNATNLSIVRRVQFSSTSTGRTVTTANLTLPIQFLFASSTGGWTLSGNYVSTSGTSLNQSALSLTAGTLNLGAGTHSMYTWEVSGSDTKVLNMDSAVLNVRSSLTLTGTNCTFTGGTSLINLGAAGISSTVSTTTGAMNQVRDLTLVSARTSRTTLGAGLTCVNLTMLGDDDVRIGSYSTTPGTITVTGTLTITGNDRLNGRIHVYSRTNGTAATISAAAKSVTNASFTDIIATGAAAPLTGTDICDFGGNTSITAHTPVTRYWVGNGGNFSDTAHWSTTSGGSTGASVPIPGDTAIFDAPSFSTASQTVTFDLIYTPQITTTAVDSNPTFVFGTRYFGNLSFTANITWSFPTEVWLMGRNNTTLTTNGVTFAKLLYIEKGNAEAGPVGKVTLMDNFVGDVSSAIEMSSGHFDMNDFNVTIANWIAWNYWWGCMWSFGSGTLNINASSAGYNGDTAINLAPFGPDSNGDGDGVVINKETGNIIFSIVENNIEAYITGGSSATPDVPFSLPAFTLQGSNTGTDVNIYHSTEALPFEMYFDSITIDGTVAKQSIRVDSTDRLATALLTINGVAGIESEIMCWNAVPATFNLYADVVDIDYGYIRGVVSETAFEAQHSIDGGYNTNLDFGPKARWNFATWG